MKKTTKFISAALAAALCAGLLAGCNSASSSSGSTSASGSASASASASASSSTSASAESIDYSKGLAENGHIDGVTALDYVTLPADYAAIPLAAGTADVSDEDVQAQIDSIMAQYAKPEQITDRAIEDGDQVNIDYSGSIDGEKFDGGTASSQSVQAGSAQFIDDFLTQIIGHTPGETFDVNVTFPDGYDASTDSDGNTVELSGKEAVFRVTVNSISEPVTPELTDEWVDSTFGTSDDVHTVEALRTYFSDALYDQNLEDAIMDSLLDNAAFKDLPSEVPGYYACMFLNYYYQLASYYSSDLDTIAQAQGYTDANAMLGASDTVITHLAKQDLLYQAIAESQGIEPTQEQLDLYALVRRTHEECVAAIHPGVEGNDIFKLSKKIIGDAGYGDYYNHGLGHGVGIDIHELPNFNRSKNIIEVGSVITMEPGVYLPGVGGVRLEDYGVVTENGYEPFTKTPHDLHVIDC